MEAFARSHNLLLVRWKYPLSERTLGRIDAAQLDDLYTNEPGLWGCFVRGAPAMLTQNIQPTKGLVNGASGFLHSLTFDADAPAEYRDAVAGPRGFKVIELAEPPLSVNFQLHLPDGASMDGIETLIPGTVVVPILAGGISQECDAVSVFSTMHAIPKTLYYNAPWLTLAFAVTDFKLPCKTLSALTLSIGPRPFPPHLDLKGLYVMISRVRRRSQLRVLRKPERRLGGWEHLYSLRHTVELGVWDKGYNNTGDWDQTLAAAASARASKKPPAPKRKACKPVPVQKVLRAAGKV